MSAPHSTLAILSPLLRLLTINLAVSDSGMHLSASTLNPRCGLVRLSPSVYCLHRTNLPGEPRLAPAVPSPGWHAF